MDWKSDTKRQAFFLLAPWVIAGFGLRLWHALLQLVMFRDETTHAFQIKHVLKGTLFNDPTYFTFPPTYAVISAPVALLTGDAELAGRLVTCALGAATAIPLFYLARDLFGLRAAAVAGFLAAVFPPFMNFGVMAESTYAFFLALSLYLANRARVAGRAPGYALFGLSMAACYLSRPEGFFVFFACLAMLGFFLVLDGVGRKRTAALMCAGLVGFMVLAFPYMLQLRTHFGAWEISGKTRINLAKAKAAETAGQGGPTDAADEKAYFDLEKNRRSLGGNVVSELSGIAKRYPGNLAVLLSDFPALAGIPVLVMFLAGLLLAMLDRGRYRGLGILAAGCLPLLLIPMVFILQRVLVPYLCVAFILAGYGIARTAELAAGLARPWRGWRPLPHVLTGLLMALVLLSQAGSLLPETDTAKVREADGVYDYYCNLRGVAESLKTSLPSGSAIISRDNIFAYYAGGEYLPIPSTDIRGLMRYARENRAEFMLYGPMEQVLRPQFQQYFFKGCDPVDDPLGDGSLRLVFVDSNSGCILYKITGQGV